MAYQVVKIQDWVITGPDGQPTPGSLVTVSDPDTRDSFNLEVPSTDPETVRAMAQAEIERRRGTLDLSFDT